MSSKRNLAQDQRGMVSFMVTFIMMLVIVLIVVGFSQVTRRNQREALDRQLSSQAFYAAESGINVTKSKVISYVQANGYSGLNGKTACTNGTNSTDYEPSVVGGQGTAISNLATGVNYTCVLVNPSPGTLQFSASQQGSIVMPLSSDANIKTLTFKWSMQDGGTKTACTSASKYDFVPSSTWGIDCDIAVLRVDLVSNPSANATNATNLYNNTVTLYLTPRGGNGATQTVSFGTATPGNVVSGADATSGSGACTSGTCKAVLTMPDNTTTYYARITAMYKDSKTVIVSGVNDNGTAKFYGAQAVVDVTGKDQDELRRVQARVALTGSNDTLPLGALAGTNGICKQFTVLPTDNVDPTDASCN